MMLLLLPTRLTASKSVRLTVTLEIGQTQRSDAYAVG